MISLITVARQESFSQRNVEKKTVILTTLILMFRQYHTRNKKNHKLKINHHNEFITVNDATSINKLVTMTLGIKLRQYLNHYVTP